MNLLPTTFEQFREKEYWDKFFVNRHRAPFEWYGDYAELKSSLDRFMTNTDRVLMSGCGNSNLSADLYDIGFRRIINVDISNVVIKQMKRLHGRKRPAMKWFHSDITKKMSFVEDGSYDVVLDKGTLDALITSGDEDVVRQVDGMFSEIERILNVKGGRYVCISLLQEHILKQILDWFISRRWDILVTRNLLNERERSHKELRGTKSSSDGHIKFPVFVVVCTKLNRTDMDHAESVLQCSLYDKSIQKTSRDILQQSVRALQQYAFLQHDLSQGKISNDDEVSLDLCIGSDEHPKYHLFVVDCPNKQADNRFAVFVVPQGRETEWLFGSRLGRKQLAECAKFERLVVAHLSRNHNFTNIDAIKAELSTKVMELAPKDLTRKCVVPFLSIGESLGKRNVHHRGTSEVTGDYIVEDVETDEKKQEIFRRLIFLNNPNIVQSEARLIPNNKVEENSTKVDPSYLACQHHVLMVAALAFVETIPSIELSEVVCRVLVIGLGGGGLPTFLHHHFPKSNVDVVELDRSVYELARNWFGFKTDDHLTVDICDGLEYVKQSPANTYDVVMVDVDSKDTTVGMSCPPESFVKTEALTNFKRILSNEGIFVLNVVCRNLELRDTVIGKVKSVFTECRSRKIDDELNEIVYARNNCDSSITLNAPGRDRFDWLNAQFKRNSNFQLTDDFISVDEMMQSLLLR